MVNIFGDRGKAGSRGQRGPIGPVGRVGPLGPKGDTGKDGARGPAGVEGSTGPAGPSGRKGERGEAGTSGIIDLYNWLPHTMLVNFQVDSEEGCFLITKGCKDVEIKKGGDIVKWTSRSLTSTLGSQKRTRKCAVITGEPCKKIEYLPDARGFLGLKKSMFKVDNVCLTNTYSFVCITFKVFGDDPDQYIVSNWEKDAQGRVFRGVSASKEEIRIHGCVGGYYTIKHDAAMWTTLFVEWALNGGKFDINNGEQKGTFTIKPPFTVLPPCVYIGGRSDNAHYFDGYLSAVEWYSSFIESNHFPDALKSLIMESQYIDDDEVDQRGEQYTPPARKKRRIDQSESSS